MAKTKRLVASGIFLALQGCSEPANQAAPISTDGFGAKALMFDDFNYDSSALFC